MKIREIKKLAKQLLAIVLIVSLVAGMQPAVAKATENTKTITNIAIATPDDKESYTFYNGFNDNWYMLPGTELVVTYSDGSTTRYVAWNPLLASDTNASGKVMAGDSWADTVMTSLVFMALDENGCPSSYIYGRDMPFELEFDSDSKEVYAKVSGMEPFSLYTAQYKDLSEMKLLSETEEIKNSRYLRLFRVTGKEGKAYEICASALAGEEVNDYARLMCYKEDGSSADTQSYDQSLMCTFSAQDKSYVIGVIGSGRYALNTQIYMKNYNGLKEIQIVSPKEVWPQFDSCTADYKLTWEDGTMSETGSIYATCYSSHYGCAINYDCEKENGQTEYKLVGVDRAATRVYASFPSGIKISTVEKGNSTHQQVYTPGTKIKLKPNETRLFYANLPAGQYLQANDYYNSLSVQLYSLEENELKELTSLTRTTPLSGEYGILVTNISNEERYFRAINLSDKEQTSKLVEYKPGQEVTLNGHEAAIYRFNASSTYKGIIGLGVCYMMSGNGVVKRVTEKDTTYDGEFFLVFRTWWSWSQGLGTSNEKNINITIQDTINLANNVSGAALKETWSSSDDDTPTPTPSPTTTPSATPSPTTTPSVTPAPTEKPSSVTGKTSSVSKVTFKATSNSVASLTEVKNTTTIKSYKVPKTVTIGGKKVKVTTIASNAFKNCKKLKKVTITSNIKTISANAFKNCKKLSTIVIDNAKSLKIKKNAFKGCKKITFKVKKSQMKKFKKMLKKAKIGCKYKVIKK